MQTANDMVAAAKLDITEVSPQQLHDAIGETPIIIDVREPGEYSEGHVFGAINIPRGVLEFQVEGHPAVAQKLAPELQLKEAPIYLYCRTGGRSALAAQSIQKMGFKNVYSLAGGYLGWEAAGFSVQK
ncbi:rhodanese-like domain-containing protein [Pleionea litopenaei]|uniref:Rhodanese-like domain-containing protein n=1 Tax=Pleionea litopenaei TaxID=3070815 RepID=A0AA51X7H5_9GAMM|nr:rhodanese-like domain-containing protein [Pleionea sp. HL-JVS1]WMS87924.1 rhodanese-like domain-containing protein [Pleionea sp. HL-JVS1]